MDGFTQRMQQAPCAPLPAWYPDWKVPSRHGVTQWLRNYRAFVRKNEKLKYFAPSPSHGIKESEITLGRPSNKPMKPPFMEVARRPVKATGVQKSRIDSQKAIIEANKCEMFYHLQERILSI